MTEKYGIKQEIIDHKDIDTPCIFYDVYLCVNGDQVKKSNDNYIPTYEEAEKWINDNGYILCQERCRRLKYI